MRPFLFSLILLFSSFSFAQKKLIVLGDSLTEGYGVAKEAAFPAVLEKKLHEAGKKEWTIINAGVSGSTTASGLSRMKWVFKSKPDVVLLALGANDGLRGLKVEDSEKHLAQSIEYAQSQKVKVILGGLYMPPNYGKDYTDKFKKMYESLAKKYKLTFIPFILDKVAGNPKYNLADGIHPNEEGHKIIADNVFSVLKGAL
ncbi:arylesterase [Bdellovibrio bacteriovorus]|uniref:Lipase/acylhydrolase domain protein n=1 Tax=Bdellovibrio bacteriovorus (strain ATCC 15356 / DSM 50701 / NCIMB 9529 / HD100) TaxID=264462 RepID=Q6MQW3_BDEBA|nr:arylesterase [Bdellovibrio bacteriovorus]AHZ85975.1 lipase [Bdellovibrio bacteriovorus]BEV66896.1 Arylesterase [Bdellovibrio bacteriovorus]CAE77995.1 lipase/acylhydrolase domain protein [Bdellovibrio bacteriovorus HD100]